MSSSMRALAGIISSSAPELSAPPRRMVERLCHDVTQRHGLTTVARVGLFVGWVTSRQGAFAANGITWSATGLVGVLFAGDDISDESSSPVALRRLATQIETDRVAALRSLNGSFQGVIIDLRDDTVTLFNDRYGLGRLYYHASDRGFFFSSEAKSLLAVLPHLRSLDPRAVAETIAVGCVLQNRSLYSGIRLLPPASAWTFRRDGHIDRQQYFDPVEWERQSTLSPIIYKQELRATFAQAAVRFLRDSSSVAMSLTGGLDSRAVMAFAAVEPGSLPCYTFGGPFRDCADVRIARQLAHLCHHPHTTIRIDPAFFSQFASLAARAVYLSDGAMDVSGAVELHVNQKAREIAPIRLTGNYGSEILRSHVAFRPRAIDRSLFTPEFSELLDQAVDTYRTEAACHRQTFIAFKQVPWHHYARFAVEKSQLIPRSPFLDNDLVALSYRAPREDEGSPRPMLDLIAHGNPSLARIGTDRAYRTRSFPIVSRLASSWQEFTAKAEYAYDYGMPQWLARADRTLSRLHLERLFLGRHKFYHFRIWYRDSLRSVVQEHGFGSSVQPFCYRAGVSQQLAREHLAGDANRTLELHQLLTLQLIDRSLLRAQ